MLRTDVSRTAYWACGPFESTTLSVGAPAPDLGGLPSPSNCPSKSESASGGSMSLLGLAWPACRSSSRSSLVVDCTLSSPSKVIVSARPPLGSILSPKLSCCHSETLNVCWSRCRTACGRAAIDWSHSFHP